MPMDAPDRVAELKAVVDALAKARYGQASDSAEVEDEAAMMGDAAYFQARLRAVEAERDEALLQVSWMSPSPGRAVPPKQALARIKAICAFWPDLYSALLAVMATHQSVPRDHLVAAIRQFRRDTDAFSAEDVSGLLAGAWNGGRHGFDAVLRSRKNSERKASAFPWMGD